MKVALPTHRQVFSGLLAKLSSNRSRTVGEFYFTLGNRRMSAPCYIPSGVRTRLGEVKAGRRSLYGEFRQGTFVVLGPDTRRGPTVTVTEGPVAAVLVTGELYRMESRISGHGSFYITGIFRFVDADGLAQTKTLLVRGATATTLRGEIAEGPITVEGFIAGETFEVTGLPREERAVAASTGGGAKRAEPAFQQKVGGVWRTLKPHQIGKGRNREPVQGKTWVPGYDRYTHKPLRPVIAVAG